MDSVTHISAGIPFSARPPEMFGTFAKIKKRRTRVCRAEMVGGQTKSRSVGTGTAIYSLEVREILADPQ